MKKENVQNLKAVLHHHAGDATALVVVIHPGEELVQILDVVPPCFNTKHRLSDINPGCYDKLMCKMGQ